MQDGTFSKHSHLEVSEGDAVHRSGSDYESPYFEVKSDCQMVSDLLSRVGDKWSILVVSVLGNGRRRFSELRREIGSVSQKMLTTTLRNLERDGFVERTVYPTIPPKVEYELTDLGRDLLRPVRAMGDWAKQNGPKVAAARKRYDRKMAEES